uniref:Uncharacterized protein n=1 Tax=Oryza sativa subsp. japonica TaxID=39947 RepID=Q6Z1N6_ORYSJ|nr:hypothetical protein [Oryza sativa Japonica Group]
MHLESKLALVVWEDSAHGHRCTGTPCRSVSACRHRYAGLCRSPTTPRRTVPTSVTTR